MTEKVYDVIIIGAGMAGLTAAIYARRANKTVLILEGKVEGGQIITTFLVGNWPGEPGISGVDLMKKIYHHANNLGAETAYEKVVEVKDLGDLKEIKTDEGSYKARAVIIATGTESRKMEVSRESEFEGRGVFYCATCDGAFYEGKDVIVVGGGNSALYSALYLAGIAKKVYVIHRREDFRADAMLVDKVRAKGNVEFVMGSRPVEILGEEVLTGLVVENLAGEKREIPATGVFVAVGRDPETKVFEGLVEMDENGYIVAGEDCKTSVPGIFVAGDCRTKGFRQLVTAAADGAIAAGGAGEL